MDPNQITQVAPPWAIVLFAVFLGLGVYAVIRGRRLKKERIAKAAADKAAWEKEAEQDRARQRDNTRGRPLPGDDPKPPRP